MSRRTVASLAGVTIMVALAGCGGGLGSSPQPPTRYRHPISRCVETVITSHRRCARDYERLPASHEAMVLWARIALMTQRLARTENPINHTLT